MKILKMFLSSLLLAFSLFVIVGEANQISAAGCGQVVSNTSNNPCSCADFPNQTYQAMGGDQFCCGFINGTQCAAAPAPGPDTGGLNLDSLNKTIFGGAPNPAFTTPRGILSYLLPFLFTLSGIVLFVMIIWGGFEMLMGAADPKSQEAGKARITAGLIGFLIIFASYWLAQLLEAIFGISILG